MFEMNQKKRRFFPLKDSFDLVVSTRKVNQQQQQNKQKNKLKEDK